MSYSRWLCLVMLRSVCFVSLRSGADSSWRVSSLGRPLHPYCGGHGLDSRKSLIFLLSQASFSLLLKRCSSLRWSLTSSFINPRFKYMIFMYSHSFCDWLANLTPVSQLVRTKTNRDLFARSPPAWRGGLLVSPVTSLSKFLGFLCYQPLYMKCCNHAPYLGVWFPHF